MLGSVGSTAVILCAFPDSQFAQPQSVIGGHRGSSAIGLRALALCGPTWWSLALAVALSAAAMMGSRTVHPPAGSTPIIVFLAAPGTLDWYFLLFPTLRGTVALVATGVLYHRASGRRYPLYWRAGQAAPAQPAVRDEKERQAA